ncbi:MAG: hypothetical protein EBU12_04120, partial [Microbacteriaceae bacterium]|nr:hypothetical protein [Microbacteriaceae bacterium]
MIKKLGLIGALLSLVGATLIPAAPAQAAFAPWLPDPIVYTVGDTVSFDLGCGENDVTNVYYQNGQLPDGLTMSNLGLVTGIPTTTGTFTLSGYYCSYNGGSYAGFIPSATVTFQINAVVTPVPTVLAHSLNTETCSFYFAYMFPVTPDFGTTFTKLENQSGTVIVGTLPADQLNGNFLYSGTSTLAQINDLPNQAGWVGTFTGNPFQCGDTITFSAGYQYKGAPVATSSVQNVVVDKPSQPATTGGAPIQKLINLNNADCQFRILSTLPTTPLPGSTKISINSYHESGQVDQLTLTIADSVAAGVMDFTFDPTQLSNGPIDVAGVASEDYQVSTSWQCGSTLYVSVEYRDLLDNYWSSTWAPQLQTDGFGITPTRPETSTPQNQEFSISAVQSNIGDCSISVVASLPDDARPVAIAITNTENNDWISGVIVYDSVSTNGVITANLSFASKDDIYASVPVADENKIFEEGQGCSGTFRAIIDSPGGILTSTLFTLGETMPTCNAGSTLDEEERRCTPVERGYYTTELNSTTPIACPPGMTTATTASKSVNDCYKPIVQSIVGFKAPKALKFNGTTNLALITNTKAVSAFTVTGPCTAKLANVVTKVKGKKVTTKMLKVTAGKKAGTCSINFTSPTTGKY